MALPAIAVLGLFGSIKAAIISSVVYILGAVAVSIVFKVLVGLGIGYVVYTGVDLMLDRAYQEIVLNMSGLPVDLLSVMRYLQIDKMINVIFSAYAVNAAFKTATLTAAFARR